MARKEIRKIIKVHLKGGAASPAPPLGPALSAAGVQVMDFCRTFNDATRSRAEETLPTEIIVYKDKTWTYNIKTSLTSDLVKKELGLAKGSAEPNRIRVGDLSQEQLERVAKVKMQDLDTNDLVMATRIVAGTCRQMGVNVEGYVWEIAAPKLRDLDEEETPAKPEGEATDEAEGEGGEK
jgi:large subunit ribosomal protein L11